VRGFTTLAEKLSPAEVVRRLDPFYAVASKTIYFYDGTLDKLVGDQVMAFFGAPFHQKGHAKRAVKAAVRIVGEMQRGLSGDHLRVGAGIATGEAYVGNVGAGELTDYTAVGDTVNVAARLQAAAAPGEILMSEQTYAFIESEFPNAPYRDLELRGRTEMVRARAVVV
jgi:adenylate cyclase